MSEKKSCCGSSTSSVEVSKDSPSHDAHRQNVRGVYAQVAKANNEDPSFFKKLQLGLYVTHVPMSWNQKNKKVLYTVVDHSQGLRFWRKDNKKSNPIESVQWGTPGDALL